MDKENYNLQLHARFYIWFMYVDP